MAQSRTPEQAVRENSNETISHFMLPDELLRTIFQLFPVGYLNVLKFVSHSFYQNSKRIYINFCGDLLRFGTLEEKGKAIFELCRLNRIELTQEEFSFLFPLQEILDKCYGMNERWPTFFLNQNQVDQLFDQYKKETSNLKYDANKFGLVDLLSLVLNNNDFSEVLKQRKFSDNKSKHINWHQVVLHRLNLQQCENLIYNAINSLYDLNLGDERYFANHHDLIIILKDLIRVFNAFSSDEAKRSRKFFAFMLISFMMKEIEWVRQGYFHIAAIYFFHILDWFSMLVPSLDIAMIKMSIHSLMTLIQKSQFWGPDFLDRGIRPFFVKCWSLLDVNFQNDVIKIFQKSIAFSSNPINERWVAFTVLGGVMGSFSDEMKRKWIAEIPFLIQKDSQAKESVTFSDNLYAVNISSFASLSSLMPPDLLEKVIEFIYAGGLNDDDEVQSFFDLVIQLPIEKRTDWMIKIAKISENNFQLKRREVSSENLELLDKSVTPEVIENCMQNLYSREHYYWLSFFVSALNLDQLESFLRQVMISNKDHYPLLFDVIVNYLHCDAADDARKNSTLIICLKNNFDFDFEGLIYQFILNEFEKQHRKTEKEAFQTQVCDALMRFNCKNIGNWGWCESIFFHHVHFLLEFFPNDGKKKVLNAKFWRDLTFEVDEDHLILLMSKSRLTPTDWKQIFGWLRELDYKENSIKKMEIFVDKTLQVLTILDPGPPLNTAKTSQLGLLASSSAGVVSEVSQDKKKVNLSLAPGKNNNN